MGPLKQHYNTAKALWRIMHHDNSLRVSLGPGGVVGKAEQKKRRWLDRVEQQANAIHCATGPFPTPLLDEPPHRLSLSGPAPGSPPVQIITTPTILDLLSQAYGGKLGSSSAWDSAFTAGNIRGGFAAAGIYPRQRSKVLDKLKGSGGDAVAAVISHHATLAGEAAMQLTGEVMAPPPVREASSQPLPSARLLTAAEHLAREAAKRAEKDAAEAEKAARKAEREEKRAAAEAAKAAKAEEREAEKLGQAFYLHMSTAPEERDWRLAGAAAVLHRILVPRPFDPAKEMNRLLAVQRYRAKREARRTARQAS